MKSSMSYCLRIMGRPFMKHVFLVFATILVIGCVSEASRISGTDSIPVVKDSGNNAILGGEDIYRLNCAGCHGLDRKGNPPVIPPLANISEKLLREGVFEILDKGKGKMLSFPHLSQEEREAIVAFLYGDAGRTVLVSLAGLGEGVFKSNCAPCHRARVDDPRPPFVQCCEPSPLAGATKRFTEQELFRLLESGVCYMPSFSHLNQTERGTLFAFIASLEGKGEPSRPTMGEMCPMVRMAAMGTEHPGMKMGAKEHPQGQKEHPSTEMPEITKETLAKFIKEYVQKEAKMKGGFFLIYDPLAKKTLALTLERVHEDRLSPLGNGLYFACADFKTPEDTLYDLDFFVKEAESGLEVSEITIHKEAGKAAIPGWRRRESGDENIPNKLSIKYGTDG